ncbi:hypothetical protein Poli38472_000261 [Pythium oligandrum]|uniref:Glutathione S-transferase n=1 Tax=Pythium oligandrum TaxID=41045 RepID=A0A8K1CBC0_PYTOL|nr:hypothetical protein Poli38472_000261 [Pythium oligandrum]|eukprot:TMW60219.1 hypothetical protein Poli38472_000261 [Pythium oligandrum]
MTFKLYGTLFSQPARAVYWMLKVKGIDIEIVHMERGNPEYQSEEFLALNPNGLIPVLEDDDFSLYESNAILTYLAEKFGWDELYPKDLKIRAKVNQYLHWHHTGARKFTTEVVVPVFFKTVGQVTPEQLVAVDKAPEVMDKYTAIVEKTLVGDYIAGTAQPTVADYALYCEYDQIEAIGLLNLDKFPKTAVWIERMKKIPFHDEVRVEMNTNFAAVGLTNQSP